LLQTRLPFLESRHPEHCEELLFLAARIHQRQQVVQQRRIKPPHRKRRIHSPRMRTADHALIHCQALPSLRSPKTSPYSNSPRISAVLTVVMPERVK